MKIKVVETKEEMKEEAEEDKNIAGYLKNNEITGDFHNIISHNISGKNRLQSEKNKENQMYNKQIEELLPVRFKHKRMGMCQYIFLRYALPKIIRTNHYETLTKPSER